jgi:hypothetical protein
LEDVFLHYYIGDEGAQTDALPQAGDGREARESAKETSSARR